MYTSTLIAIALSAAGSVSALPQAGANLPSYAPYSNYGSYPAPAPPAPAPPAPQSYNPYVSYGQYRREAEAAPEAQGSYAPYSGYGSYGNPSPPSSNPPPVQPNQYLPGTCKAGTCNLNSPAGATVSCDATAPCTKDGNACTFYTGNTPGNNPFATGKANCT